MTRNLLQRRAASPPRLLWPCLVVALLATGCGDGFSAEEEAAAGGTTGAAGLDTVGASLPDCGPESFDGNLDVAVYSVPVPTELEPYANFPVKNVWLCWLGNELVLGYSLPKLLTGKSQHVSFQGGWNETTQTFEMSSADGTAVCTPASPIWSCFETFANIKYDQAKLAQLLEGLPPAEVQARLDVAAIFIGDPIGILDAPVP